MRETLFRGKRADENEWIYGFVNKHRGDAIYDNCGNVVNAEDMYICDYAEKVDTGRYGMNYKVIPETIGQYIGLKDANGKKIFEGDIVKAVYKSNYTGVPDTDFGIGVVYFDDAYYGGAAYKINIIGESGSRVFSNNLEVKVIGNIYDNNPELLKGVTDA